MRSRRAKARLHCMVTNGSGSTGLGKNTCISIISLRSVIAITGTGSSCSTKKKLSMRPVRFLRSRPISRIPPFRKKKIIGSICLSIPQVCSWRCIRISPPSRSPYWRRSMKVPAFPMSHIIRRSR